MTSTYLVLKNCHILIFKRVKIKNAEVNLITNSDRSSARSALNSAQNINQIHSKKSSIKGKKIIFIYIILGKFIFYFFQRYVTIEK